MGFFRDWYTDTVDIYRVAPLKEGNITNNRRQMVHQAVPCRVYRSGASGPHMAMPAARSQGDEKLACGLSVDIQAGDELQVTRGGLLPQGASNKPERYFAGDIQQFYDPVGRFRTGLGHKEVGLLKENVIGGGA